MCGMEVMEEENRRTIVCTGFAGTDVSVRPFPGGWQTLTCDPMMNTADDTHRIMNKILPFDQGGP